MPHTSSHTLRSVPWMLGLSYSLSVQCSFHTLRSSFSLPPIPERLPVHIVLQFPADMSDCSPADRSDGSFYWFLLLQASIHPIVWDSEKTPVPPDSSLLPESGLHIGLLSILFFGKSQFSLVQDSDKRFDLPESQSPLHLEKQSDNTLLFHIPFRYIGLHGNPSPHNPWCFRSQPSLSLPFRISEQDHVFELPVLLRFHRSDILPMWSVHRDIPNKRRLVPHLSRHGIEHPAAL